MNQRLPALPGLAKEISTARIAKRQRVSDSISHLVSNAQDLRGFSDLESLAEAAYGIDPPDSTAKAAAHHILTIRAEVARQLWRRDLFVGVSVIDELLFQHVAAGASDPLLATLQTLRAGELKKPGMLVFPLHSFGVYAAGLLRPFRGTSVSLVNSAQNFAVIPQTNKLDHTLNRLNEIGAQLGTSKPVDGELIRHLHTSRNAKWLEYNPLLIAAVRSVSGMYYENEFLLLGRIRAITASLVMLAALQPRTQSRKAALFSSSRINNWETLDIHHYIVLTSGVGKNLGGHAIPIHQRRAVTELSDLAVEIGPRYWGRYQARANNVYRAVGDLYAGYMNYSLGVPKEDSRGRTYRKLFEAVTYFRRSYSGSGEDWAATVSLATAFEMLLTDSFERGVAQRLRRRTRALLKGARGTVGYQKAVEELYYSRSATVHSGVVPTFPLEEARKAFVLAFCALMQRIPALGARQEKPIAHLTGVE
ncbi:hypothetical protein ACGFIW_33030 [Micromonospora sp. NPDC048935]|uniref:hypothetical protein n=1 Tax=Micromonospora sp. NPDC048935 TaxID=3364262 RepID=UPI00371E3F43